MFEEPTSLDGKQSLEWEDQCLQGRYISYIWDIWDMWITLHNIAFPYTKGLIKMKKIPRAYFQNYLLKSQLSVSKKMQIVMLLLYQNSSLQISCWFPSLFYFVLGDSQPLYFSSCLLRFLFLLYFEFIFLFLTSWYHLSICFSSLRPRWIKDFTVSL